ncbi:MAG: helix-turn-helix transcriptional regulator [Polyangiaceae bacterium]|nr:helix-turn-helix transcriptional regulator [Polyangiaceae bacterium]
MGLRQVDLAEHLGVTGETVSRWENDAESFTRAAQLAVLALLCEVEKHGELRRPVVSGSGKSRVLKVAG